MKKNIILLLTFWANLTVAQKVVRYDLYVRDTLVNFSGTPPAGKEKRAIAVNGQIPMPTLTFTEGDTAEIYVHNELNEETSLHWHGLLLPNKYDGVPNLTQMPIKPHSHIVQISVHFHHAIHHFHSLKIFEFWHWFGKELDRKSVV